MKASSLKLDRLPRQARAEIRSEFPDTHAMNYRLCPFIIFGFDAITVPKTVLFAPLREALCESIKTEAELPTTTSAFRIGKHTILSFQYIDLIKSATMRTRRKNSASFQAVIKLAVELRNGNADKMRVSSDPQ